MEAKYAPKTYLLSIYSLDLCDRKGGIGDAVVAHPRDERGQEGGAAAPDDVHREGGAPGSPQAGNRAELPAADARPHPRRLPRETD